MGIDTAEVVAEKMAKVVFERVVQGLTQGAEAAGGVARLENRAPREIIFSGTFDEVGEFFAGQEWSDGLAIVPPTMERIEKFLRYTSLAPDATVGILPPSNLKAVPLNIAANAVMAGCRPEHMPLLIAAVEALADEKCNLYNAGSTSGIVPFLVVNGPIVRQLGIEHGGQLISRGANPVLGRAISLIVRNIAGFRPGKNYMGTFGYPLAFTLAEDESATPWEPFHVEQGFDRSANTVTVGVTNKWGPSSEPSATPDKSAAQVSLELLCREIPDYRAEGGDGDGDAGDLARDREAARRRRLLEEGRARVRLRARADAAARVRVDHPLHLPARHDGAAEGGGGRAAEGIPRRAGRPGAHPQGTRDRAAIRTGTG
jgi:hypothetical protein